MPHDTPPPPGGSMPDDPGWWEDHDEHDPGYDPAEDWLERVLELTEQRMARKAEEGDATRFHPGGSFILDGDDTFVPLWGEEDQVAWAEGESLWVCGPQGVAQLVLTSALPCIVVPQAACQREAHHACIAVAWNGSIEAIGALHGALPLLQAAQRVVVLSGTQHPAAAGLMRFDLDTWAEQHGVGIEYLMLDSGEDAGPALLDAAQEVAADLLVAGAYGRSRLAEWVLGGVTRHLLRHSTLPLLLRH